MDRTDDYANPRSKDQIAQKAYAWREAFRCNDAWSPDVISIVEDLLPQIDDAYTLRVLSPAEMGGKLGLTNFSPPEICLREDVYKEARRSEGRARFTVAHELGHLLLQSLQERPRIASVDDQRVQKRFMSAEWQANYFAACFLMSENIVRQFSSPLDLSHGCNVSLSAAEYRMRDLGLFNRKRKTPEVVKEYLKSRGRWPPSR